VYLLGYDIGSSSIKAALVEADSGKVLKIVQSPQREMDMISRHPGWAEQHPEIWWENVCTATKSLLSSTDIAPELIKGIGIAYQMHGLVLVDKDQNVLRPSIIWCDSRAVEIGDAAFEAIGAEKCLKHLLNSPGNFTASKLKWVKDNEPELYEKIDKIMLPGDYIAMKLTGKVCSTISGLSEGILWDFQENKIADLVLDHYGISTDLMPDLVDTFSIQGQLSETAARQTGLNIGTPVAYRAGDQPNNALSLGVFEPDTVAATGGTSGVVYGVVDQAIYDLQSRINGFAHVNHSTENPRLGLLLCINGAGIQYAWVKQQMGSDGIGYEDMERMAKSIPVGAEDLRIIPFGNGAERMLTNKNPGAQINNIQFNRHGKAHLYRAALEGIAFSFIYGFQVLKELGLHPNVIKVGNDNLFRSEVFSRTVANLMGCSIEVVKTTGAVGAAKGSGMGIGLYKDLKEAMKNNEIEQVYHPQEATATYVQAYEKWVSDLEHLMNKL
jgi:xylulokinase